MELIKDLVIELLVLVDLGELKAAGSQKCRRCPAQQFDMQVMLDVPGHIDDIALDQTLDAMTHAVYFLGTALFSCGVDAC